MFWHTSGCIYNKRGMNYNIHKYDRVKFHNNILTHKRIKALLLWFEYEVHKNNLPLESQIELLDRWLDRLLKDELYEVLPFFQGLKADMENKLKNRNTDIIADNLTNQNHDYVIKSQKHLNYSAKPKSESFLTRMTSKIIKWLRE